MYSLSSALRALCGVAAGSSKASLSAHFAKWGNLGELNAVSWSFSVWFLAGWRLIESRKTQVKKPLYP